MNYFLTEEQEIIKELSAKIADEKIAPRATEFDESEEFPWDSFALLQMLTYLQSGFRKSTEAWEVACSNNVLWWKSCPGLAQQWQYLMQQADSEGSPS